MESGLPDVPAVPVPSIFNQIPPAAIVPLVMSDCVTSVNVELSSECSNEISK